MQHPFQCITAVQTGGHDSHIIAACGSTLICMSLESGEIVSEWSAEVTLPTEPNGKPQEESTSQPSEPPAKRQKTSSEAPEDDTKQQQPPTKKIKQQKKNASPPKSTAIILLTTSPNHSHLGVVTDDKSIRVFTLPDLQELGSPREMPKRPCAIQIPPSNDTILIADKHGDVYSLPLVPSDTPKAEIPAPEKQFKPSATNLTVHSKRNLTALQAQQKQLQFTPRKDVLSSFENSLLLGHVSMLTDMKFLSLEGDKRQWLATCDRDEHIRISRAPPQSHIIEGFCLGHTSFISRICQVGKWLVSGGGDAWLGVWDFGSMTLVRKISLGEEKVAVSGLWSVGDGVIVTFEKVQSLFFVPNVEEGEGSVIPLKDFPLDVVVLGSKVLVSLDSRESGNFRVQVIDVTSGKEDLAFTGTLAKMNAYAGAAAGKELDGLLYNVANLRKRGPLEGGEAMEEDATVVEES